MSELTILDGGMGLELSRRGFGKNKGLWSAHALVEHPQEVADVHDDFVEAGARVITTNSYSTIPSYLEKDGIADRYLELTEAAARIARTVADASLHEVSVAGSLPPLDVSYRWDLVPSDREAATIYESLAEILLPHVDIFLCETMSCAREGRNAVSAARKVAGVERPVWISWTLSETPGGGLRSGETIKEAYEAVAEFAPDAFLFNCTHPSAIGAGLVELRKLTEKPIGGYPNRFNVPGGWTLDNDVDVEPTEMTEAEFLSHTEEWRSAGASIIGGCCGVGPEFISAFVKTLAR